MGAMQELEGALIFVRSIALFSRSASSFAIRLGCARVFSFAVAQISLATLGPTRLNSCCRNADNQRWVLSLSILISMPSSTPCGCGLISSVSAGFSLVPRS